MTSAAATASAEPPAPVAPDYAGASLCGLFPSLLGAGPPSGQFPVDVAPTASTVLLLLDGLGWEQFLDRRHLTPTLNEFEGGPITTVAPTTTATALTSLTTGLTPGEHGVIGYRMVVEGEVLNTLRWGTDSRPDARKTIPPTIVQPYDPFLGQQVGMVTKAEFRTSGFSRAHLRGSEMTGYRTVSALIHETARLVREGAPLVYAYYDGVDKVSHEYGLRSEFDLEVSFADRLVGSLMEQLPAGTRVLITADHGQVDCADDLIPIDPAIMAHTEGLSGEGRFRWLHAQPGHHDELLVTAQACHGHHAWVRSVDQMVDDHWFGRSVRGEVRDRLGDVALLPFEPIAFDDPADSGPFSLVGRHGSLTAAEMLVPLLSATS